MRDVHSRSVHGEEPCMYIRTRLTCRCFQYFTAEGKIILLLANPGSMNYSIHWAGEARRLLTRQMYLSQHYVCRGALDTHTLKLSRYSCSRIASSARKPHIPRVLGG